MRADLRGDVVLLAAVRAALAALDDAAASARARDTGIDALRVERYLSATLVFDHRLSPVGTESRATVRAACRLLREGEVLDAYLALHAARVALDPAAP